MAHSGFLLCECCRRNDEQGTSIPDPSTAFPCTQTMCGNGKDVFHPVGWKPAHGLPGNGWARGSLGFSQLPSHLLESECLPQSKDFCYGMAGHSSWDGGCCFFHAFFCSRIRYQQVSQCTNAPESPQSRSLAGSFLGTVVFLLAIPLGTCSTLGWIGSHWLFKHSPSAKATALKKLNVVLMFL